MSTVATAHADLTARDANFQRVMQRVQQSMKRLNETMQRVGKVARNAFIVAAGAIGGLVKLASDQENATRRLDAALMVSGESVERWSGELLNASNRIQDMTVHGNESIQMLMAYAAANGVAASRLEETAKNAIGLARITGQDLNASMRNLILATQGEFTMLQRYIPALREAETETEKLAIVTEFSQRGFALAQEDTKTFTGELAQLKNELGDVAKELGARFLPGLTEYVRKIREAIPAGESFIATHGGMIAKIGGFTLAASAATFALAKLTQVMTFLVTTVLGKFILVIGAITVAVAGMLKLYQRLTGETVEVGKTMSWLAEQIHKVAVALGFARSQQERLSDEYRKAYQRAREAQQAFAGADNEQERLAAIRDEIKALEDMERIMRQNLTLRQQQIAESDDPEATDRLRELIRETQEGLEQIRSRRNELEDTAEEIRESMSGAFSPDNLGINDAVERGKFFWDRMDERVQSARSKIDALRDSQRSFLQRFELFGLDGEEAALVQLNQRVQDMMREARELGLERLIPDIIERAGREADRIRKRFKEEDDIEASRQAPQFEGLQDTFRRIQQSAFSGGVEERTAQAAEKTAENTKSAVDEARKGAASAKKTESIIQKILSRVENIDRRFDPTARFA